MRKAVMIINPQSGKKKKIKNYTAFYDILRKYGYEAQLKLTERKRSCHRNNTRLT